MITHYSKSQFILVDYRIIFKFCDKEAVNCKEINEGAMKKPHTVDKVYLKRSEGI